MVVLIELLLQVPATDEDTEIRIDFIHLATLQMPQQLNNEIL
jgi:hypothetical protein